MTTGDQADFLRRLKAALPSNWFPDETPVLDGILSGLAAVWQQSYALLTYVADQRRIATASGVNLDLIANDFLSTNLPRREGEGDNAYRARLKAAIFQEQGTRAAIIAAIIALTGEPPTVFEPSLPSDTGGYGSQGMTVGTGLGYGVAGGWGSLDLPFQAFVTAFRPVGTAPAGVQGYYSLGSQQPAFGGYGVGSLEYTTMDTGIVSASDEEVYSSVDAVKPIGTIIWMRIDDRTETPGEGDLPETTPTLDDNFVLDVSRLA